MIAFLVFLAPVLFWAAAWAIGRREMRRLPRLKAAEAPGDAPSVTAVIPARDEAGTIELCLRTVLAQRYPTLAVVAVDDASTDGTGAILDSLAASDGRLTVKRASAVPDGWTGKNHALWTGVEGVASEWILFTDADTSHHPDTLAAAMKLARETRADAVTLLPFVPCRDGWSRAVQPVVAFLLGAALLPTSPDDPRAKRPLLNGQYLLIRRETYERIGGHKRVRGRVVEDLAIGEQLVLYKRKLVHALADELLTCEMYRGLPRLWSGWGKGFYELVGARPFAAFALALGVLWLGVLPFAGWVAGAAYLAAVFAGWATGGEFGAAAAAAFLGGGVASALSIPARAETLKMMRIASLWSLALPVGSAVVAAMLLYAPIARASGAGAAWKGRRYPGVSPGADSR